MKNFSVVIVFLFIFTILAICDGKGGRSSGGGRSSSSKSSSSSSSSRGKSSSSSSSSGGKSSSSSSGSGSSYPKQQYNYGQPSHNSGQPSSNYGQPSPNLGHPSPNFGQPFPNAPPLPNFGHPSPNFGQPNLGKPFPNAPPSPNFGQPFPNAPPLPNFGHPSPNFGQPNLGKPFPNAPPSPNFGQPNLGQPFPNGYPSPNFGQPSPNFGQPFPKGPPSTNYGKPSHNYGQAPAIQSGNAKNKKSKTNAIVGAAVGAYAAHNARKRLKKVFKKPKISGVGGYRVISRPGRIRGTTFLAQVSPNEWGSRPITLVNLRSGAETNKIIVHHTTFDDCYNLSACIDVLKKVEARNIDVLGYPNIGYNFMLGGDGRIYVGLGWHHYSTITNTTFDPQALQVAFIGDFSIYRPNDKQLRAFKDLVRYADKKDYIKRYQIHAHRDVKPCTSCPGDALYIKLKEFSRYKPLLDHVIACPSSFNQSITDQPNSSANLTTLGFVDSRNITSVEI